MTTRPVDLSGLEAVLAGASAAVAEAVPGPGLALAANTLREAVVAVAAADRGGDPDAEWVATNVGGRIAVFGPDLVMSASTEGRTVHTLRATVGDRSLQCDFGDPTARVDTSPEQVVAGGLSGLGDQLRGAILGRLAGTPGGIRVRLTEDGRTTADWIFDDTGSGEPMASIAERELEDAAAALEDDFGTAADPEDMPPPGATGSVRTATRGAAAGGVASTAGGAVPAIGAAAASAAAAALVRKARQRRRSEPRPSPDADPVGAEHEAAGPTCPRCGHEAISSARFCPQCGAELGSSPEPDEVQVSPATPEAAPPTPPAPPAWTPSHVVGPGGLNARREPDPHAAVIAELAPGVQLAVVRTWGDWAQVVADNGWTAWVDGRRLQPLG